MNQASKGNNDALHQGRDDYLMDIDRMVNEGLAGGLVTDQNGLIEETTTDSMDGVVSTDERYRKQRIKRGGLE